MKFMRDGGSYIRDREGGDPMEGVANLFDAAVVFIAALLLALLTVFDARELFSAKSELTIVRKNDKGDMTVIRKKGRKVKALKMTREEAAGRGTRLGTAYKLEDGSVVYVPEE